MLIPNSQISVYFIQGGEGVVFCCGFRGESSKSGRGAHPAMNKQGLMNRLNIAPLTMVDLPK